MEKMLLPGMRVRVPLGNKVVTGFCVGLTYTPFTEKTKDILSIIDSTRLVDDALLSITKWLSSHYFCSWGEALNAIVPPVARRQLGKKKLATLSMKTAHTMETSRSSLVLQQQINFTAEQQHAMDVIDKKLAMPEPGVVLLHGITGSGKTEVYLQTVRKVVESGRKVIFLVPEISLTSQTIQRIKARFDRVAILHSHLSGTYHYSQWNMIREHKADIVVGARSAIFAPLQNVGLIVIDEEHEHAYKQECTPRYSARDVAIQRAFCEKAMVILGTATPSLETYYHAMTGEYTRLILSKRIGGLQLPSVEIIDMREEIRTHRKYILISRQLEYYMKQSLARNEQVILFLNRRGFTPYVYCKRCGFVLKCERCDIPMIFHKKAHTILCHYCHAGKSPMEICPECLASTVSFRGYGTEKIEEEILDKFPGYKVLRMDSDSMRTRGAYEKAFAAFERGEYNILLGTQMIAKGLDFPNITLVGVISADTMLNIPDFRSSERTFQLILQVAGRAGRGPRGGRVVVQTLNPGHYSITHAVAHDYEGFARKELEYRKQLKYPPFVKLARLVFSSLCEEKAKERTIFITNRLKEITNRDHLEVLGPSPAPISRINNKYRWQCLLKSHNYTAIYNALQDIDDLLRKSRDIQAMVDVDPCMML